jgi:hypothetical protein
MLTSTCFRNNPRLAHMLGQQSLTDRIIHLMRAGVVQILALEIDLCPAGARCQPLS